MKSPSSRLNRRRFLGTAAAGVAAFQLPRFIPGEVLGAPGRPGANEQVNIGVIGVGSRAWDLLEILPKVPEARVVAIADCSFPRTEETLKRFKADWRPYQHYRKMIDAEKLDAVMVPTREHQRLLTCIHACQAGLDIFAEKPLALSIHEGRVLVQAVQKHRRVFQVDTQQRSVPIDKWACEFIEGGGIGKVHTVIGAHYPGTLPMPPLGQSSVPEGLDWDLWLNQCPWHPYSETLHKRYKGPVFTRSNISVGHWHRYGTGEVGNLGAHGLDMIQFALGASESGPVEVWPLTSEYSDDLDRRIYFCPVAMRYPSGAVVRLERRDGDNQAWNWSGAIFIGDQGKIEIKRNALAANPKELIASAPPPGRDGIEEGSDTPRAYITIEHIQNWIDCIKSREKPNAHEEIAQRTNTVIHLVLIARRLGRRLRWDPEREAFPDDSEANALLNPPRREGYELPAIADL